MSVEVAIPEVGESVTEAQIVQWLKQPGDWVEVDEDLVEIETDKATVRVPSPAAGAVSEILKKDGEICDVGTVIAQIDDSQKRPADARSKKKQDETPSQRKSDSSSAQPAAEEPPSEEGRAPFVMPAAAKLLEEHGLSPGMLEPTGPGGRLLKEDVIRHLEEHGDGTAGKRSTSSPEGREAQPGPAAGDREERAVPMSMIRRRVADRLVQAQQNAALLTTVNEIDMTDVMELRRKYREAFEKKYDIRLGFMSFFVKAAIEGLKASPELNAEIRGRDIVYRNYYDVGIAVGAGKGLVVPVIRSAERLSFAEVEQAIGNLAKRAQQNELTPEELAGGTFTITNGGVYGSLLSAPIVNPPQSGILALHAIQERPVAREGQVVIRPMMYVALTYDHRIVDGREAIGFLRRVKEIIEDPARMLLEV